MGLRPGLRAEPKVVTRVGYEPANLPTTGKGLNPSGRGGGQQIEGVNTRGEWRQRLLDYGD